MTDDCEKCMRIRKLIEQYKDDDGMLVGDEFFVDEVFRIYDE
jgi:hypothetical protein